MEQLAELTPFLLSGIAGGLIVRFLPNIRLWRAQWLMRRRVRAQIADPLPVDDAELKRAVLRSAVYDPAIDRTHRTAAARFAEHKRRLGLD